MSKTNKRILTEDDLLKFCQEQNFANFSSKDTGYQLALKVPTTFEVDDTVDDNHRGMIRLKIRIFHTGLNRNKSFVSKESAEKAMNTIADRPLLAAIHQLDDGSWDFEGHEMEVLTDEAGNEELHYIESQVGSFSSEPAFWEHDDELDKDFVCAYAYISTEYTKAAEILEAKQGSKNSCELFIDKLAYNSKEKYLELLDFYVNASTLLGSRDDGTEIQEGMQGSCAVIEDFSVKNNSIKFDKDSKMIELLESLNKTLSNFNKNNTQQKGGNSVNKELFENLLAKYNRTAEDITFEYENLSDKDLTAKFAEMFDEDTDPDPDTGSDGDSGDSDSSSEGDGDGQDSTDDDDESEEKHENPDDVSPANQKKTYTIEFNGVTRTFEVSYNDKITALQELVNATYSDADNTWYGVTVYDEYLVMHDYWYGKHYKQTYTQEGNEFTLTGDRVEVFVNYLTKEQEETLANMKANYSELVQYKTDTENAKLRAEKEAVLSDEKYSILCQKNDKGEFENEAYAKLYSEMDNYSVEDLTKELKGVFCDYVTSVGNYSALDNNTKGAKKISFGSLKSKPKKRYGTLFDKN